MNDTSSKDSPSVRPAARGNPAAPDARKRVLECAAALLEESGPEGLTIRRLSAASGFTPPAIYSLFGDKAGLVDALVRRIFTQLAETVASIERTGDPRDFARRSYLALVRYGRTNPHQFRLLEERLPSATSSLGPSLEQWRAGMPTPLFEGTGVGLDPDLMRQVFWSMLHGLVTLPPLRRDVAWREDLAGFAFDAMLDGILARAGAEAAAGQGTGD